MANVGFKYPKGTHWTQRPENKEKLAAMVRNGARNRARRPHKRVASKSKAEAVVERAVRKHPNFGRIVSEDTSVLVNGWRITLGHKSIKIEQS